MGSCTSQRPNPPNSIMRTQIDQPLMTQGELSFKVLLKNIKLTLPGVRQCQIQFEIMQNTYISPMHINVECQHQWRASYETTFKITEDAMKTQFVNISVLSPKVVGTTKINLFEAAVGPWHFDLPIINESAKKVGRVRFDFKMSQVIEATIQSVLINVEMKSSISDVAYNYNLRLVTPQISFISEHSSSYTNPNYRKRDDKPLKSGIFTRKSLLDSQISLNAEAPTPSRPIVPYAAQYHTVEWDHTQDEDGCIRLIVELPVVELMNSAIQVCVWSVQGHPHPRDGSSKHITRTQKTRKILAKHDSEYQDMEIQDHHLVAETYISLAQNLDENMQVGFGDKKFIRLHCQQPKQIWYHGMEVGKIQYDINITLPTYLQQSSLGCQTEKGIIQQILVVGQLDQISVVEIQQINGEFQKLSQTVFKMENKKLPVKEKLQCRYEAETSLAKLEKYLVQTHSDQIKIFHYKSEEDLFKAQELFIEISSHLIEFSDTLASISVDQLYSNLNAVLGRGELMLAQLGYFKDLSKKQLAMKTEICIKYQNFLISTLKLVLHKINQKDPNKEARKFTTKYLVIAYFRIPEFRVKLLEAISHPDDPPLTETRGTEFIQEEDPSNIDKSTKQNIQIFDWQNYFHVYIQDNPKAIANQSVLNLVLNDDSWKESMKHRSTNFCFFVEEWAAYVRNIIQQKIIPWQDIPGYRTLTKAFMCELKLQDQFTDAMKSALKSLMQNPNLLSIVVTLLYNKTNLYSADNVVELFDTFNICFSTLSVMPPYFDYPFFMKGIKQILIDSEHAMSLAKCIWFLYNQYGLFPLEFKRDICEFLFEKVVLKLYLHWSKTVRSIFHHLLIFRVYHQHRNSHITQQDEELLLQQYMVMARPKKQQSYFESRHQQNQLISDFIFMKYVRFLARIEQAKQSEMGKSHDPEPLNLYCRLLQKKAMLNMKKTPSFHFEETTSPGKKVSQKQVSPVLLTPLEIEVDEIKQLDSKPLIVPRPILHRHITYKSEGGINDSLLKYVLLSIKEFEEVMRSYNNWKQQKMKALLSRGRLSDEEKLTVHITFEVPQFDVLKRFDEKEGI